MGRGERDPFSLRRIPSAWTSSWRRPSNTAAPRGLPPAVDQRMTTTRRSAGRSKKQQVEAAEGVRFKIIFICQGFFGMIVSFFSPLTCVKTGCEECHFRC